MSEVRLYEGTAPVTPPAGVVTIYAKIDGRLYWKTDDGVETPFYPVGAGTGDLLSDGTVAMSANWNMGNFQITMGTLVLTEAAAAPMTVTSTQLVTNLNADLLDGNQASAFQPAGSYLAAEDIDTLAELNAIVTDATLVDQGDIVLVADTSLVGAGFFLDEDNMVSDDDTKVPSQQSVKAYVDMKTAGANIYQGEYNATTNTPDLTTSPNAILQGQYWVVGTAGTFFTANVEVGDTLIAEQDDPSAEAHWTILQTNLDAASVKTLYESNANTNEFDDQEKLDLGNALVTTRSGEIAGLTEKITPVNDDVVVIEDSEATNSKKKVKLSNMLGGGGGGMTVTNVKTANYTASANEVVPVDSTGGPFTVTWPASPSAQDRIIVIDVGKACGTHYVTVARNGNTIDGVAEDFVIDQDNGRIDGSFDGVGDWATHLIGAPTLVNVNDFATGFRATNAQTGTTYTFTQGDLVDCVVANNAAASTYNIPDGLASDGETLNLLNIGAGVVTITVSGTDTLSSTDNTVPQDDAISILNVGGTAWRVIGGSA